MKAMWRERRRGERGFTLVELMVVIAIIGILAAIAVPAYTGYQEKARIKAAQAEGHNLATAAQIYYIDKDEGAWPTLTQLVTGKYVDVTEIALPDGTEQGWYNAATAATENYKYEWYLKGSNSPKVTVVDGKVTTP